MATVLGLRDTVDPAAGFAEFLEDRNLLLVLDNCEHLVDECVALVTKLLAASSRVQLLAASRHVLRAEGRAHPARRADGRAAKLGQWRGWRFGQGRGSPTR